MNQEPKKTPLYDWHVARGARMVDFAGWSMPVQYSSIVEEHHAVRRAAGLFDISHMGRLQFSGPGRVELLDHLTTNHVAALAEGQAHYSLITNPEGGIRDDVLVYRFGDYHLMICNASNREKILQWIKQNRGPYDAQCTDRTEQWSMLALQGPHAETVLASLVTADLTAIRYYRATQTQVCECSAIVSRTGYTGEDGFELIVPASAAMACADAIVEQGRAGGLLPAGLGARDTLRLEAAMPLYGHELAEEIDPFQAGLGFAVRLEKGEFVSRDALIRRRDDPQRPVRIGLELQGRRIAREGSMVWTSGEQVGHVTSGTFSPTLEKSIAMGYVRRERASPGAALEVDIRGRRVPATVVPLPFYKRPRKAPAR